MSTFEDFWMAKFLEGKGRPDGGHLFGLFKIRLAQSDATGSPRTPSLGIFDWHHGCSFCGATAIDMLSSLA